MAERQTFIEPTPPSSKKLKLNDGEALAITHKTHLEPRPISFRSFLASAYSFYEEEKLIQLESRQPLTHIRTLTEGSKKKQAAQGDKLMLKLKKLLDYVPRSYKNWERSKMQKIFHRNFMQATCLHLYRNDPDIRQHHPITSGHSMIIDLIFQELH